MAERKGGDTTLRELQPGYEGDPVYGLRVIRRFEGPKDDIVSQGQIFMAGGFTVSMEPVAGSWYRLYVRAPNAQEPNQPPVDTWERTVERVQEDIRNNPKVIAAAVAAAGGDPGAGVSELNKWHKEAKELIKSGTGLVYANPDRQAFFELMSRGAEAFLVRRIIARRRRIIASNVPAQSDVNAVEEFYSTAKLIEIFAIPPDVASKLPVGGNAPSNTAWGWMERMDTSITTPAYAQTEEIKDWVFSAHSTFLYDYIS